MSTQPNALVSIDKPSRGPRTVRGKNSVRLNSVTHGLSSLAAVVRGERKKEWLAFRAGITESIKPMGTLEEELTEQVASIMPEGIRFGYIGRPERASPGEGYPAAHIDEQNRIVTTTIDLGQPISQYPHKVPGDR